MLVLDRVSKHYRIRGGAQRHILRDVSAVFRPGDAVGILGRNGAGKSTLVRMLAGVESPSSGRIERRMSVSWPLAHGVGLHPSLTGADNARFVARVYGQDERRVMEEVEAFAELGAYMGMPVRTYSLGMTGRLLMGLSLAVDFDCYLVDEILAAGDAAFMQRAQAALAGKLRGRTLVLVSHIPELIQMYCRTAAVLHQGRLTFHEDIHEAVAAYQAL